MSLALRIAALCFVLAVSAAALGVFTASNTIPASSVGRSQSTINAPALEPQACIAAGITITNTTVVTNGVGTAQNDLILATATGSTLTGNGGKDCMIGGAGVDTFNGNGKNAGDVCIGNGGTDVNSANKCQNFTQ